MIAVAMTDGPRLSEVLIVAALIGLAIGCLAATLLVHLRERSRRRAARARLDHLARLTWTDNPRT